MINAQDFIKSLSLQVLSPSSRQEWDIHSAELNRPGLQFVGFYEHFAEERPQVVGLTEMSYLESLPEEVRQERLEMYFSYALPCVILCRGMRPPQEMQQLAQAHDVALLRSDLITTRFTVNAMNYLNRCLAPRATLHGVLVDVYGVGVLITGESGVGKSEAALELVKRGHQLVADDVVDVCRVTDSRLTGESPETVRHFMEIRGIGIIDIKAMYGVGAVLMSKSIDLVIHLEPWKEKKAYDRLGLEEQYMEILGVKIPMNTIPITPGRNLAVILEVAAINVRQRKLGYNAAQEFTDQINKHFASLEGKE